MGSAPAIQERRLAPPIRIESINDPVACRAYASDADTDTGHAPTAVMLPRNTEEVAELVAWANKTGTGIVPVSSTGRRRRGDTVPQRASTVVADLSRMGRLIHADGRDKIVIIEPGVDFATIDGLLEPHGLRALRPLAPRAGKSVIASYLLQREPLINANEHWDSGDPFGGTNLVLGNGRVSPTGSAATEGSLAQQLAHGHRQMVSVGPRNLDLLRVVQGAQGSLGVMTWAAIFCERIPVMEESWFCSADTLEPLIDLARDLLHLRLGNAVFIVDSLQLAMLLRDDASSLQLQHALPAWTLFVSISAGKYRPVEKMAWQRATVRTRAASHGVDCRAEWAGHTAAELSRRLRRSDPVCFRDRPLGAHHELFFTQQLNRAGQYVSLVRAEMARAGCSEAPLGVYIQPVAQGVSCHVEFTVPYDPSAKDLPGQLGAWRAAARACAESRAYFSRPYGEWVELAFPRKAQPSLMMRMAKSILDPQDVMNPGRLPY